VTGFREPFPVLAVDDVERSAEFYVANLGFEQVYRNPPEGEADFVFLRLDPHGIGLAKAERAEREMTLCVYADDVDEAAAGLRDAGVEEIEPPADQDWGERMATFRDPDGYLLQVFTRIE
jgi:lactoylglutathione lyase